MNGCSVERARTRYSSGCECCAAHSCCCKATFAWDKRKVFLPLLFDETSFSDVLTQPHKHRGKRSDIEQVQLACALGEGEGGVGAVSLAQCRVDRHT